MNRKKLLLLLAAALLIVLAALDLLREERVSEVEEVIPRLPYEKRSAFDFSFEDLKGAGWELSDFRGNVLLVNFRVLDCSACEHELPYLEQLKRVFKDNESIEIIMLFVNEKQAAVSDYVARESLDFPVYLDTSGYSARKYEVFFYPTTVIIDKDFNLISKAVGAQEWSAPEIVGFLNMLSHE